MSQFQELISEVETKIKQITNLDDLEKLKISFLGKKGIIRGKLLQLKNLPLNERPKLGLEINQAKQKIEELISDSKKNLDKQALYLALQKEDIDITLSGRCNQQGNLHPITQIINRIQNFFYLQGFHIGQGPEIEDEYHNFDALNIAKDHSARAEHDTFWLSDGNLLRTHTTNVQIRIMEKQKPPIKFIAPGKVYRNDYDQTHTPMFHQIEGLVVGKDINFLHLKKLIESFLHYTFTKKINFRFRASYFPFTEPSVEVDIQDQTGKWIEVLGCGMVHPQVLKNVNIDTKQYSGFAFGVGIERLAMLRYQVNDIRAFFENDSRFLKQF